MGYTSDPRFLTMHALRIKGFAKVDVLAELAALEHDHVEGHLVCLQDDGHAMFREARALWQLTPDGRTVHAERLAADVEASGAAEQLCQPYGEFLELNESFKALCGDWQLRDGEPNDHSDGSYDGEVIARLGKLDAEARPIVNALGTALSRLMPYAPRLEAVCQRVAGGETNMFTGVMCGSYHDVWMELHEDLILTQGIDRTEEGSF
ncbi:MAG: MarR family transcriptional regulator [Ilumatobacteraceae bacterium]